MVVSLLCLEAAWLPQCIISDCRPQFVALFTRELYRLLGIWLALSIAWHLQIDRQIEHVNQELDQYLQIFVNKHQNNWYDLLLLAEFQHNNHVYTSTQQISFLLNTSWNPQIDFRPRQWSSALETVNEFMEQIRIAIKETKSTIQKAQEDIVCYYNQRRTLASMFSPRDKVFLDALDIKTMYSSTKLSHQRLRPFTIEQWVVPMVYQLKLPLAIKRLHLIFNMVKLSATLNDPISEWRPTPLSLLIIVDREEKWKVEEILNTCWH